MSDKARIIFMGTPEFAVPTLLRLIQNNYPIVGVITQPDKQTGRKHMLTASPVKKIAREHKLPIFQFTKLDNEATSKIKSLEPDLIVVVAYGKILPQAFLDIPKFGCLNIHPSLLPLYRGPSPIQGAILNGEGTTGITIIKMDKDMDHGPIVYQQKFEILDDDNAETMHNLLAVEGAEMLIKILPKVLEGKFKTTPQDDSKATYTKIITKDDAKINWKKPALEIYCQIRAYYPNPGAWTDITGKKIKILKSHIEDFQLVLDMVQPEGKQPMKYSDYLNGHQPII